MIRALADREKNLRSVAANNLTLTDGRQLMWKCLKICKVMYKAIIEIPKGNNRRRHWNKERKEFVDLGPLKDVIPVNNGIAPVNYGFIIDTFNEADGDEIDVLVLSNSVVSVGQELEIRPIAVIKRADGDHKVVAVDSTIQNIQEWQDIVESERSIIEDFVSHHFAIEKIEDAKSTERYIDNNRVKT